MMMKHLYLIRHCKTEYNYSGKITGKSEIPLININIEYPEQIKVDIYDTIIITSPLQRCVQTVDQIIAIMGYHIPVFKDARLSERDMGEWEGKPKKLIIDIYGELFHRGRFIYSHTPPKGEQYDQFFSRVKNFIDDLYSQLTLNNVIICAHNQVLKLIYAIVLNIDIENIWYSHQFRNGVLTQIL